MGIEEDYLMILVNVMRIVPVNGFKKAGGKSFYWYHDHRELSAIRGKADRPGGN